MNREPVAFVIEDRRTGVLIDGDDSVFGDLRAASDRAFDLNDDLPVGETHFFVVPLYRGVDSIDEKKKTRVRRTERGFAIYTEFKDRYAKNICVVASSLATERCVWIQNEVTFHMGTALASAHLTVPMAKRVIRALQKFVDGVD